MEINYFDLSGGINQASTKTELGTNTKPLYWYDSHNIEIYDNKGLIKQNGNSLYLELPVKEPIIAMREMERNGVYKLVIVTSSGLIYVYNPNVQTLDKINKKLSGKDVKMECFLRGMLIATESDEMFYLKNSANYEVYNCNLVGPDGDVIYPDFISVYKGRVWCAKESTIFYSALGTYDNFTLEDDAGYINDFHTDTADITAMHTYKDYLAIYKRERVYLLSGSSPEDFTIVPFADKGAVSGNAVINVDNKQYFLSNGIFALEQVGELNQIRLGSEISLVINNEFSNFDKNRLSKTMALHYQNKHQMWFFFPYSGNQYYNTIWINDYLNKAWYKRVLPQKITTSCVFNSLILTADNEGKIYIEDNGSTFNGEPIDFMWKSPFLSLTNVHHRKLIDEFYFILDDTYHNKFNFSVYKDYDTNVEDDKELIFSKVLNNFSWAEDDTNDPDSCWAEETESPVWAIGADIIEKAEICGSCFSVQLCVSGQNANENCAIIGLQFREIYSDD